MGVSHPRVSPQGPILGPYPRVLGSGSQPRVAVPLLRYALQNTMYVMITDIITNSCANMLFSILHNVKFDLQKQLQEVFYNTKLFYQFYNIHRKIPALESFFNKVKVKVSQYSLENTFLGVSSNTGVFLSILQNFKK